MVKNLLSFFLFIFCFCHLKSQNVYENLNFICSNQSISVGSPVETEYDNILTSCHWQPLSSYIEFYQVIIESGTTFTFTITPNANVDYDFASWLNPNPANLGYPDRSSQNNPALTNIYNIGLSLTELNQLCEGGNSTGYPEPGFVRYYEVQPGDMIIIAVDRWTEDNQGYTISFGGNAELSCTFTYSLCDGDGNGQEDFNLNDIALNIQQTRYPEYNITFYDTQTNAQNGTGLGLLTGNYTAYTANNPNIIYARLENQSGGFIEAVDIKLNVNGFPEINEFPTLFYCGDSNDLGLFNLTDAFENIINNPENYSIKFYRSQQGAQNENVNDEILTPLSYLSESATVYVRIRNEFGCHVIKELNLVVANNLTPQTIQYPVICLGETDGSLNLEDFRESLTDANYNSYHFEYYLNQTDAQNGNTGNSITSPGNFPIMAGTTYTIYVRIIMGTNCSPIVSSISFTVGLIPLLTIDSPQNVCSGNSITLTAQTQSGLTVNWYDSQTSTSPIFTGNNFTTPNLTDATTYWVEAVSTEGCASERISVEIIVNEHPTFTISDVEVELCEGMSASLEVTTGIGNTVNWYLNQTDTTPIYTGNPFTTPNLTTNTTYWVEVTSDKGCPSEREEITIGIVDERTPEFTQIEPICFGEIFILPEEDLLNEITGTWTPAIDNTQTTTYTFHPDAGQCAAENVTMTVEVVQIPELRLPVPIEICSGETASITITTTGEDVNWYANETDTTPIHTGLTFSEELTETTTYWLEAIDGNCKSDRESFTVTVNPLPIIQAETSTVCEGNPSELSVITDGQTVNWYDSQTAATPIFTGNPFITPNLTETTIYYAESINSNNCVSERIPVTAIVTDEITPEFNLQSQYCLNSEEIILPRTDENGLTGVWTPSTIDTNNLGTMIYTFEPDLECAETITKTITIVEIIVPEFDELIQNYCLNATPEILPNQSENGIQGTWFPAQINTNLQGTTTYIFTPNDNQCSEEFKLSVTVYPHPDMDLEEELLICEGDSFTYTAPDGFDSYQWKDESNQIISETQEVTFTEEGIYTLTVEINGIPCDLSRNIEVRFSTPPTITEVKTTENSITIYATGGHPLEYSMNQVFWQSSPTFTNLQPGIFNVYVRDAKGCSTTAKQAGILGVPNFISPNGDGYNDVWELRGLEVYPNTRLQIFDRFGKIFVDKMIESSFIWDGKYNSQPLPSGGYWYILILENGQKISGNINVKNY